MRAAIAGSASVAATLISILSPTIGSVGIIPRWVIAIAFFFSLVPWESLASSSVVTESVS